MEQCIGYIINEAVTESDSVIVAQKSGKAYATGIIQDLEAENRNGRIYEISEMDPELKSERFLELMNAGYLRGHAGHPSSQELSIQSVIDPKLVCVQFDKIWRDGKDIHANFHGTNNDLGKMFNDDLLEGCKPAFSLRALGSVDRNRNGKCYVKNIRIITWDHVIYPSHKKAYTHKLIDPKDAQNTVNESAILLPDNKLHKASLISESTAMNGNIITVSNKSVNGYIKEESANIKSIINTFDTIYESAMIVNNGKSVSLSLGNGDKMIVNLEQYIQDEIYNYADKY